jgi:hypothetical protein
VHQHILAERGDEPSEVKACRRVVPDGRDLDLLLEQFATSEQAPELVVRQRPTLYGIVAGPLRFGGQWAQEQDVVKADDVLDDRPCVPSGTRRRSPPVPDGRGNRVAEPRAYADVPPGEVFFGHVDQGPSRSSGERDRAR